MLHTCCVCSSSLHPYKAALQYLHVHAFVSFSKWEQNKKQANVSYNKLFSQLKLKPAWPAGTLLCKRNNLAGTRVYLLCKPIALLTYFNWAAEKTTLLTRDIFFLLGCWTENIQACLCTDGTALHLHDDLICDRSKAHHQQQRCRYVSAVFMHFLWGKS